MSSRRPAAAPLAAEALTVAREIAGELATLELTDASLRGSSGVWLLVHELGADAPAIPPATVRRWEAAAIAGLAALEASFFEGMLGAAWLLAVLGRAPDELAAVDAAVLEVLHDRWDGGLAAFGGGLAGFGSYGLVRTRTSAGRRIVQRCVALFGELAHRDGGSAWWAPGTASLPHALRDQAPPLWNREGSAAAIAFLAAAAATAPSALPLARRGARALALPLGRAAHDRIGVATSHAAPGLIHGSGTWALGGAGAVGALLSVARATRDLRAVARCGRMLADLDPAACAASDASLGTGTAGIACVVQALAEATRQPVFAFAAEHWHRRTLRGRRPGEGIGGYLHVDPLGNVAGGAGRWAARPGLLDGAAGTALSLLCAARGVRASPWFARCFVA
jgi:hypothetical protein